MSANHHPQKRLKKPPACDSCKARRVLCHPQPNGAPCPRCVEKNTICTTTPVIRGRPKKPAFHPKRSLAVASLSPSSSTLVATPALETTDDDACPPLTPEFVSHCFECLEFLPQINHPLMKITSIRSTLHDCAYSLHYPSLTPQARVCALAIISMASLASFHDSILGPGSRPSSLLDWGFFYGDCGGGDVAKDNDNDNDNGSIFVPWSTTNTRTANGDVLRGCGLRRARAFRALRAKTLKAAWDAGVMLESTEENALTCFLLDLLEQSDSTSPTRPWAAACIMHIRALAPRWRKYGHTASDESRWAGFFMSEALFATARRMPMMITLHDQRHLCGSEPPPLETLLASLEATRKPGIQVVWASMKPFLFHVTNLARELHLEINGDHPRLHPLSSAAVLRYLSALTLLQSVASLLLARIDALALPCPPSDRWADSGSVDTTARACGYGIAVGLAGVILPFYRELQMRCVEAAGEEDGIVNGGGNGSGVGGAGIDEDAATIFSSASPSQSQYRAQSQSRQSSAYIIKRRERERLQTYLGQAHEIAVQGAKDIARALRHMPPVHYTPLNWRVVFPWAEFCMEEVETAGAGGGGGWVDAEEVDTFLNELKILGYSLDSVSAPRALDVMNRMEAFLKRTKTPASASVSSPSAFCPASLPAATPASTSTSSTSTSPSSVLLSPHIQVIPQRQRELEMDEPVAAYGGEADAFSMSMDSAALAALLMPLGDQAWMAGQQVHGVLDVDSGGGGFGFEELDFMRG
ncbi:Zn(2)-C6 fungal-type domain-containing protein [Favolaschia claudopus]|uniref:Zn(2)-C6 fungal-type domain-containing protein n=1 Tax=Favolaschia claudopus TaxID=2862362 RepID=A0AAW0CV44_9AGAR